MGLRKMLRGVARRFQSPPSQALGFSFDRFGWLLSRDPAGIPELALSPQVDADDHSLVRRVMSAYSRAYQCFAPSRSFWDQSIRALNSDIHEVLAGMDEGAAAEKLRNPASNSHFWGFDAIAVHKGKTEPHEAVLANLNRKLDWRRMYAVWLCDTLTSLADAIGARRLSYPEGGQREVYSAPDLLLDEIEKTMGRALVFPNPYAGELGLATRRGILSFRAIQSLYQAWRIAQFARGKSAFRVLEIGAGLGRTAYFANQFGIADYTIIDIPLTSAAQGYFLGRVVGEDKVSLYGEPQRAPIKIRSTSELDQIEGGFDLIVNVDLLTEMQREVAQNYWEYAKKATRTILSINHEANPIVIRSLYEGDPTLDVTRSPYWLRRGYVEEVIRVRA